MSDDLVKRLRQGDHFEKVMSAAQSADRIEELEAKLATCKKYSDAYLEMDRITREALSRTDAKLEKAVEGFEKLACLGNGDRYGNSDGNVIAQRYIAELTGGKDE